MDTKGTHATMLPDPVASEVVVQDESVTPAKRQRAKKADPQEEIRKFFYDAKKDDVVGYILLDGTGGLFKVVQRQSTPGRFGTVTLTLERTDAAGVRKQSTLDYKTQGQNIVALGTVKKKRKALTGF